MITILGYGDKLSVRPGDSIGFKLSVEDAETVFYADVVRLRCTDDSPEGPGFREAPVPSAIDGAYPARRQVTWAGSHVLVPSSPTFDRLAAITLEVWVWPTTPERGTQGLLTRWSQDRGLGLVIDAAGCAALRVGSFELSSGTPLAGRVWTRIAGAFDRASGRAWLVQRPREPAPLAHEPALAEAAVPEAPDAVGLPVVMAAWHGGFSGTGHIPRGLYNGKLARPSIWSRAFGPERLLAGDLPERGRVARWDFSLAMESMTAMDAGPNALHGTIENLPDRAMTGPFWTGETLDWRRNPVEYDAIHFHEDDLLDCRWESDLTWQVPDDTGSGVYALRCRTGTGVERIPFFVVPPADGARADVAVLMPTATCIVYGNGHFAYDEPLDEMVRGSLVTLSPHDVYLNEHRELGLSSYDTHADGSGVLSVTRHRPILNLRPLGRLWNFNLDMYIVDWLEARGTGYDIITDEDLHAEGIDLLSPYRVVVTGSHPEYVSWTMMEALHAWRDAGGRLMYLGGNGFYWRISFHPTVAGVIEARRTEGTRSWDVEPGERHHSFDGALGGLWRYQRYHPNGLLGVGMNSEGFDRCGWYRRTAASRDPRYAWVFDGVPEDARIGERGVCGGGAAGYETDRMDHGLGTPGNAVLLASSEGLGRYYELVTEELAFTTPAISADENTMVRADMVMFACPNGGAVFSVGSIAWAGGLPVDGYDNHVARITGNVLDRFRDPAPLWTEAPGPVARAVG